jgi:hypothetical protein
VAAGLGAVHQDSENIQLSERMQRVVRFILGEDAL